MADLKESARLGRLGRLVALAREHPGWAAALKGLVLLTILAALPIDPEGPHDARTRERAEGFRLEFPLVGALFEPLAAPGHVIAGAPDHRVAGVSTLVWIVAVAGALALVSEMRRRPRPAAVMAALRTAGRAAAAAGVFLAYVAFALAVRLPSWRLVVQPEHDEGSREDATDAHYLVADLQAHTFGSHDGLVGPREGLEWHKGRGFDVVAITEHDDATGSFAARKLAEFFQDELPAVIPGVEIRSREGAYLLALGLEPARGAVRGRDDGGLAQHKGREDLFCEATRTLHGGATLALAWKLRPEDVRRLAEAGVDGFEIANMGHPDVPPETRRAILSEAAARGLVLVASSDWHGWSGFWRTWTVVRVPDAPGAAGPPARRRARAVVRALRERRAEDIVPLVAGHLGPPSAARAVMSPLVESVRYACELSAPRVVSWWAWAALVALVARALGRWGLRAGRVLLALLLLMLAAGLAWRGGALLLARAAGETSTAFPGEVGLAFAAVALASFLAAMALVVLEVLRVLPAEEEDDGGSG